MTVYQLIADLENKSAVVDVVDGKLKINIASEYMTADLQQYIKENKAAIIQYLMERKEGVKRIDEKPHYATSSVQKRMFFLYEFDKSSLAYNLPQLIRLEGTLDTEELSKAFRRLIQRHENLRTSFELIDEEPVQKIAASCDFELEQWTAGEELDESIRKFIRPFALDQAPLFRAGLIKVKPNEHILMMDMHHIITDGVSQSILIHDFMQLYSRKSLPPIKLSYKDFAEWQQSKKMVRAADKQFWNNEFAEEAPVLELPTDFKRPQVRKYEGDTFRFDIRPEQTVILEYIAKQENTTMFNMLFAIFYVLLAKLSNQKDVVVGITTAGRQDADLENVIGMFVNTLPLRQRIDGKQSFRAFLRQVQKKTLQGLDHQAYSYEELLDDIKVERNTSHNPLFDVLFSFLNFEEPEFKIPGLSLQPIEKRHKVSKFDLTLTGFETGRKIQMEIEYSTELFQAQTIERFATYFQQVVSTVCADPTLSIADMKIASEEEQEALIWGFNNTNAEFPEQETIVSLFEKQVEKAPDRVALRYEEESMTYRALYQKMCKMAAFLQKKYDLRAGDLAGVMLERGMWLIPSIFGILKSGAAYVPIDPHYPMGRIDSIVEDSGLKLLLTRGKYIEKRQINGTIIVDLDELSAEIEAQNPTDATAVFDSRQLAYVIYTSGSTGKPKGVMIEHSAVVNRIHWMNNKYPITEGDVLLQKTPIVFDVSVWELFWWSFTGASLCLLKPGGEKDPQELIRTIEKNRVTNIHFVPSMLAIFLASIPEDFEFGRLKSLRQVFTSGEALRPEHVNTFGKGIHANCQTELSNLYGPTEATVDVTYFDCTFDEACTLVPIGRPIDNIQLYVLDQFEQLAPVGVSGELCIGGIGLARGYLNNETLTNEKFVAHPRLQGKRIYRTGDLARWMPDGNIEFLGRIDHQEKIRGFRIEPGEIEKQLMTHPAIDEAVVLAKGMDDDKFLAAYYLAQEEIPSVDIRNFLMDKLPEYMVPTFYMHLSEFPLSVNGKLNRKALPDPEVKISETHIPPTGETQKALVEIWADVLKVEQDKIGINISFFDIGGNSLKLIKTVNKVNQRFGAKLTVAKMFKLPTISSLSKYLTEDHSEKKKEDGQKVAQSKSRRNQTLALLAQRKR
ncbi:MAG: amino acid adenylation domain-containing protein [Bacteroidota bacterium]